MSQYRRLYLPGSTYFLTANLHDRSASLLIDHVAVLRMAFRQVMRDHPFGLPGIVILPDHLHLLMSLSEGDSDFSMRIRLIKRCFTTHLPEPSVSPWQKRFWEHRIRNENDFRAHLDYIHINPVKHGHVDIADRWPYSSIHRYIAEGNLPAGWGSAIPPLVVGERRGG